MYKKILFIFTYTIFFALEVNARSLSPRSLDAETSGDVFNNTVINNQVIINNSKLAADQFQPISILPKIAKNNDFAFRHMENWQRKGRLSNHVTLQNSFGQFGGTVVDLYYHVDFSYGGSYQNKGEYIHALAISIDNLFVMDGLELNSHVKILSIVNIGTKNNPKVLLSFQVYFIAFRLFNTMSHSDIYYISGDGLVNKEEAVRD